MERKKPFLTNCKVLTHTKISTRGIFAIILAFFQIDAQIDKKLTCVHRQYLNNIRSWHPLNNIFTFQKKMYTHFCAQNFSLLCSQLFGDIKRSCYRFPMFFHFRRSTPTLGCKWNIVRKRVRLNSCSFLPRRRRFCGCVLSFRGWIG